RTGDKIFIVVAYYRTAPVTAETFRGEDVQAPPYIPPTPPQPQAQAPYYPQYPTGPLAWPAQSQQPQQPQQPQGYGYPQYAQPQPPAQGGYPYGYNPLLTGPLPMNTGVLSPTALATV